MSLFKEGGLPKGGKGGKPGHPKKKNRASLFLPERREGGGREFHSRKICAERNCGGGEGGGTASYIPLSKVAIRVKDQGGRQFPSPFSLYQKKRAKKSFFSRSGKGVKGKEVGDWPDFSEKRKRTTFLVKEKRFEKREEEEKRRARNFQS